MKFSKIISFSSSSSSTSFFGNCCSSSLYARATLRRSSADYSLCLLDFIIKLLRVKLSFQLILSNTTDAALFMIDGRVSFTIITEIRITTKKPDTKASVSRMNKATRPSNVMFLNKKGCIKIMESTVTCSNTKARR